MPIVLDRKTGEVLSSQKFTPQQNRKAWEIIIREYVKKHPEALLDEKYKENDND